MYIEKIKSPADLKGLDIEALNIVADETRRAVLNRVSKHGGHVGPNLGFVEATVALHYVFDAPVDKFVFDVSHQCYPHKVLTGRAAGFLGDVDDMNAISGYSSPSECPEYDNFEVGHTSTSVSLATGLQKARDVKGTHENIIAVIGDGSLSGGEAFEGLDEASELGTGIIIVVNDNEMSIAENHGGIYKNLRALRESNGACEHNWFKAWGFEYTYLEEGNDIAKLIDVFRSVKDTDRPTVVHIHTEKGHGYAPAVQNKEAWHWGLPFNLDDGSRPVRNADGSMPDVVPAEDYAVLFSDWMLREMKFDPMLIACSRWIHSRKAQGGRFAAYRHGHSRGAGCSNDIGHGEGRTASRLDCIQHLHTAHLRPDSAGPLHQCQSGCHQRCGRRRALHERHHTHLPVRHTDALQHPRSCLSCAHYL